MNITILTYSVISFILFYFLAKISYKLNLVDLPNKRKLHSKATAFTGGIIISIIFLIGIKYFKVSEEDLNLILSIGFLIACVGFIDDIYNLNTGGKLSLQIIPVFYLIVFEGLILNDIGDYNIFILRLGSFSVPFTFLCVLFLINSFNYFDGLDGTLSFSSLSTLLILCYLVPSSDFRLFILIIIIPLCIFLMFNFSIFKLPKIFLGDGGSLLLGFIISFILIFLAKEKISHPIILAWSVNIFVYEFLSLNLIRLKNKKNPFKASQDHLHHILYNKTKSKFLTNLFISVTNFIFFVCGYFSFLINPLSSFIFFVALFFIFFNLRNLYSKK